MEEYAMTGIQYGMQLEEREASLCISPGFQGTGKSYQTIHMIVRYMKMHPNRKILIYDVQGEFTHENCLKHGVNINIPILPHDVASIQRFTAHQYERVRRIVPIDPATGQRLDIKGMKMLLADILKNMGKGLLLIEDMNKYLRQTKDMDEIVSILIGLRHQNLDAIIHLQSLAKIDPTLWENTKYIRMHWQTDSLDRIKGRIPNYRLCKVAQLLVDHMYYDKGNERFFCWVYPQKNKICGQFSEADFKLAYYRYLKAEKNELKEMCSMLGLDKNKIADRERAVNECYKRAIKMYGNKL